MFRTEDAYREGSDLVQILLADALPVFLSDVAGQALRDLSDVPAVIPVFGDRRLATEVLHIACVHAEGEQLHLPAAIVVVELAMHVPAGPGKKRRDRVTERCLAAMTDVQGSGRVRGNELDHYARSPSGLAPPPRLIAGENVKEHGRHHLGRQPEIEEARPSDLDGFNPRVP